MILDQERVDAGAEVVERVLARLVEHLLNGARRARRAGQGEEVHDADDGELLVEGRHRAMFAAAIRPGKNGPSTSGSPIRQ